MSETITATEANRNFSKLLKRVEQGHSIVITNHGTPVAEIVPPREARPEEERKLEHQEFIAFLRSFPARNLGRWTRDELYDDDPGTDE